MNNSEFVQATSKLEQYYQKEYATEQLKIMFDLLKDWNVEKYIKAINFCIMNSKFLPKVADLRNVDIDIKTIQNKEEIEFQKCDKCNGEGFVRYFKKVDNGENPLKYEYIALCTCDNARKQKEINGYDLPDLYELGL